MCLDEIGLNCELLIWGAVIVFAILVEMGTVALISLWFVFGAIAAFISAYNGQPFLYQAYWFVGVSAVLFLLIRPLAGNVNRQKVATNVDALVGKSAVVCSLIDASQGIGRVEVEGLSWSARPADGNSIPMNTVVKIERIEGVTLIVSSMVK